MTSSAEVRAVFARQRAAFAADPMPNYQVRATRLRALHKAMLEHREALATAIDVDYGGRSWHETMFLDVFAVVSLIRYTLARLRGWMRPQRRSVELFLQPAQAHVVYQPKGVVGIIAPWNYPVYLSIGPLCAALAAGDRAIVKPSEAVPRTSDAIATMLRSVFDEDVVAVATGGPDVSEALSSLPLDHLFFTGSSTVARHVLRVAAENLTPVTLELGGKSPLIVHPSYPADRAAKRIVVAKFFNAGQTCVAPDYALVHKGSRQRLVKALEQAIRDAYPSVMGNPDYTSIIDQRHVARLRGIVDDARAKGATVVEVGRDGRPGDAPTSRRTFVPTLLLDVDDDMRAMRDEIFGPVLPIVEYDALEDAIAFVNGRPRPLTLSYFDDDARRIRQVLRSTISGGVCVNEAALHVLNPDLPFGGIGGSGFGAYHAEAGFRTFSHAKAVLSRGRLNSANLLTPPYGSLFERIVRFLIGS